MAWSSTPVDPGYSFAWTISEDGMTITKTLEGGTVTVVRTEQLFGGDCVEIRFMVHSSRLDDCDFVGFIAPSFSSCAINRRSPPNFALQLITGALRSQGVTIPGKVLDLPNSTGAFGEFSAEIVLSCDLEQKLCRVTRGEATVECEWPECPRELYFASSLRGIGGFVTILEAGSGGGLTKGAR